MTIIVMENWLNHSSQVNILYQHVLRGLNGLEPDEGDLHRKDGAEGVDGGVRDVDPVGVPSADHQDENVNRNQVDQEHVTAPRRHLGKGFF